MKGNLKIVLGTITVMGVLLEGVERFYKPSVILLEGSKSYPEWLAWLRWLITLSAVIGYLILDWPERKKMKSEFLLCPSLIR